MSKVTEINGKVVDYKVKSSPENIILSPDEMGTITTVITESDSEPNSLYVGDVHIASGYGLRNLETKNAVEELLSNENVKKLLTSETHENHQEQPSEITDLTIEIPDSSVNINNSMIGLRNGELIAESWINIYNPIVELSNGDKVSLGGNIDVSVFENNLSISYVYFYYDIKKDSTTVQLNYLIDTELEVFDNSTEFVTSNTETFNATGTKTWKKITVNKSLNIDYTKISYSHPVNLIITDENKNNISFIKLCDITYKYPIFITSVPDIDNSILESTQQYSLYDRKHGSELTLPNADNSYHYIWVPSLLTANGFAIIHKESNIGCKFRIDYSNVKINTLISNTNCTQQYNRYISPWKYSGTITWIIK